MLNRVKSLFNRKILAFSLFLVFAIAAAIGFYNSESKLLDGVSNVAIVETEEPKEIIEQDFLTLNVTNIKKPHISKTATADNGNWNDANNGTIDGGEYITITAGSATVLDKTFTPNNGYAHTGFAIYAGSSESAEKLVFKIIFNNGKLDVTDINGNLVNSNTSSGGTISVTEKEFKCTPEDIITSNYSDTNNQIFIKALTEVITYELDLFYQASNSANTYSKKSVQYNIMQEVDLTTNGNTDDGISNWGYWILRKDAIVNGTYYGYTISVDTANNIISVTKDGVNVSFTYEKEIDKGYKLTTLNKGSYGNITQLGTNPLIAAKISRTYVSTIDNSNAEWATSALTKVDSNNKLLAGAVSNEGKVGGSDYKAKLTIKDHSNYAYSFTNNNGYAFYKSDEIYALTGNKTDIKPTINDAYYYVYNYGYEISGWKIYIYYNDGNNLTNDYYGLQYKDSTDDNVDNLTWSLTEGKANASAISAISISNLNQSVNDADTTGTNLADLSYFAEKVDLMFAGTSVKTSDISLVLSPVWNAVNITLSAEDSIDDFEASNSVIIKYNDENGYNIDIAAPNGKSSINYKTSSNNVVVKSGKFNYVNIPHSDFGNSVSTKEYVLTLTAEYVDNMYKVLLNGISSTDVLNTSADSVYASSTLYNSAIFTYESYSQSGYTYVSHSSGLIENYINTKFIPLKNTYIDGINVSNAGTNFEILNKVYGLKEDKGVEDDSEYIYLTNNHIYTMPVFNRDYYELIFYTNAVNSYYNYKTFVYDQGTTTEKLDYDVALANVSDITYGDGEGEYVNGAAYFAVNPNWNFSDGGSISNFAINAHWFRKYYNLDIHTILKDETADSFHGYVVVKIEDKVDTTDTDEDGVKGKGGNYIVLFYDGGMKIYKHDGTIKELNIDGYLLESDGKTLSYIKLYAGCDLTLNAIDQSKDLQAVTNDDNCLDMVGYRYVSTICNKLVGGNDFINSTNYTITKDADTFNSFTSGEVLPIYAEFENINYQLNVKLDNALAGGLKIVENLTRSEKIGGSEYSIPFATNTYLNLGDIYTITYNSNVGYELKTDAFTLTKVGVNGYKTLQVNTNGKTDAEKEYIQTYTLHFTSAWLRDNYYKTLDPSFTTSDVVDGGDEDKKPDLQININTQAIDFTIGLKVFDGTEYSTYYVHYNTDRGIFEVSEEKSLTNCNIQTFSLSENDGKIPFNIGNILWSMYDSSYTPDKFITCCLDLNKKSYALLSSRMYSPNLDGDAPSDTTELYYKSYDFLLTDLPEDVFKLDSVILSKMVNYSNNKIVRDENREIFILLQARELYSLNVSVLSSDKPDPDGDREVIVSNGKNNNVEITKQPAESVKVYTYKGAENVMVANYNTNMYSGVEYYLGNVKLNGTSFKTTEDNQNLKIKYVVKPLSAQVKYFVDGVEKIAQTMVEDDYISNISYYALNGATFINPNDIYVGYKAKYYCELVNNDYNLSITINTKAYALNADYDVTANDYAYNGLKIVVSLDTKPKDIIQVRYVLIEKAIEGEPYYGNIVVYEDNVIQPNENTTGSNDVIVSIVEGREVYIALTINEGYKYHGYKYNTNSINTSVSLTSVGSVNNVLYICEEYELDENAGLYVIYLEKIDVTATLTIEGDYLSYDIDADYVTKTYSTNGKVQTLTNLYANKTIYFSAVEVDREVLDYFYYTDKSGNIVNLTEDGTAEGEPIMSLTLTSDVLETLPKKQDGTYAVEFKVVTTPKYKLNYAVSGMDYVDNFASYVDGDTEQVYNSGDFYVKGTKIYFDLQTIEYGKYKILVYKDGVILGDSLNELNALNFEFIDSDINILIQVVPVQYKLNIDEKVYANLTDLENLTPTSVEVGTYSGLTSKNYNYKQELVLNLNLFTKNGSNLVTEINTLVISGNSKTESLVLTFKDGEIIQTQVVTESGEIVTDEETISAITSMFNINVDANKNAVNISYTVLEAVTLKLHYLEYKTIQPES